MVDFRERLREAHIVLPPLERMSLLVTKGEAGLVAKMLMHDPKVMVLPDDEKRALVTQALEKRLELAQNPTVTEAAERKIKGIRSGHKEGKALTRQFKHMFPEARVK